MTHDEVVRSISDDLDELEALEAARPFTCFSCLKSYPTGEFRGECPTCGTQICGIGDCKGTCLCTLLEEDTGE